MICRILFMMMALLPLSCAMDAGIMDKLHSAFSKEAPPKPPSIRVLIAHDQPGVILEVKGKYKIYDPRTNEHIASSFSGKRKFIQPVSDGIKWGEEFPGVYQLLIVPDNPQTATIVDGIEYLGSMYVYDIGGTISVVNKVNIEDYLSATLPHRYKDPLPEEVMAAIAIAARTNTYYMAQNSKTPFWDVEASKVSYHGHALTKRSKEIEKAINDTRYMVLSRIGTSDWVQTPFAVDWRPGPGGKIVPGTLYSAITIEDAVQLSKKGYHAAQILAKAFPETSIQIMHYAP